MTTFKTPQQPAVDPFEGSETQKKESLLRRAGMIGIGLLDDHLPVPHLHRMDLRAVELRP